MRLNISIIVVLICAETFAQSNNDNYVVLRDKGIACMKSGQYADAAFKFEGAESFAHDKKNKVEIANWQSQLRDSINNTFSRAERYRNTGGRTNSELAIIEYGKLIGTDKKYIYSYIGMCYENIPNLELARYNFNLGMQKGDEFAAYKLAELYRTTKSPVSDDSIKNLYQIASPSCSYANDSLGIEYERTNEFTNAYKYYKKSGSGWGKYRLAKLLITYPNLSNDNPIDILKSLSQNNNLDATYYLGTLYFSGQSVSKDEKMGLNLIKIAAKNGCMPAKKWMQNYEAVTVATNTPQRQENDESMFQTSERNWWKWSKVGSDEKTWGLAYSYSKNFPAALFANYTISYFSIGFESGYNLDKKKYVIHENETGNPQCFFAVSPGFYDRYFLINFGVGFLLDSRTKSSSNFTSSGYAFASTNVDKYSLFLKPSIIGYIPICDGDYYITVNAGYNIMTKLKDLNGPSFGVGFQVTI
jgi:hypothetical protein